MPTPTTPVKLLVWPIDERKLNLARHAHRPGEWDSWAYRRTANPTYQKQWDAANFDARTVGYELWRRHFDNSAQVPDPIIRISKRLGKPLWENRFYREVQGKTYWWGIVVSFNAYLNTPPKKRARWLENLLKHELVHYAGRWHHKADFWRDLKAIGGSN